MDIQEIVTELKYNMKQDGRDKYIFDEKVATEVLERLLASQDQTKTDKSLDVEWLVFCKTLAERDSLEPREGLMVKVEATDELYVYEDNMRKTDLRHERRFQVGYTTPKKITNLDIEKRCSDNTEEFTDRWVLEKFCEHFNLLEE